MNTLSASPRTGQAWRLSPICLAICLLGLHPAAHALPQGGQVVQGQAGIQNKTPGQMDIRQSTDKAIINWQSFSIAQGELLHIVQPSTQSVLLNRVTGADPSFIYGKLQANGQVFLLNPRGMVFGQGSQIDAGGFMASTLGLSDSHFMSGRYELAAGAEAPGALQADGRISAPGGTVALVAPQLSVGGTIEADRVALAAASTALVDVEGDGLVLFNVRNDQLDTRLTLTGRLRADGGSAELRAQARAGFADTVLNMDGVVQARSLGQREGRIVIDGGTVGITQVSGTLDATGTRAGEHGGSITVLGDQVGLFGHALLDASGDAGGGSALVGGNFHGAGPEHNAERTYLGADARVRADALTLGNGGQVAVWADQRTDVYGQISAHGGALSGDGGAVETSGRHTLNMPMGAVDVGAPKGTAGTWLLDPDNLRIGSTPPTDTHITPSGTAPISVFTTSGIDAVLSVDTLRAALSNNTVVTVTTSNAVRSPTDQAGNISIEAPITTSLASGQTASLTLNAQGNISFTNGGTAPTTGSIASGAGSLNVTLNAGANANGISMAAGTSINTGGGILMASASGDIQLGAITAGNLLVNSLGGNISQVGAGVVATGSSTVDAGTGSITLTNAANHFGGALLLTGGATRVVDSGALTLSAIDTGDFSVISHGDLNLGTGTIKGTLDATSNNGAINQRSQLPADHLSVTGATSLNAGTGNITLTRVGNDFLGPLALTGGTTQVTDVNTLSLSALSTGDFFVTSHGGLNLGQGSVSGTLSAISNGGVITQITTGSNQLSITGATTLDAGAGNITLAQPGNDFVGAVSLTGGALQLQDINALTIQARSQTADQALTLTAGSTLTLPAGNINTGNADLSLSSLGGTLNLLGPVSGQSVSLTSASGLTLDQNIVARLNLTLNTTNAPITQTAGSIAVGGSGLGGSHVNAGTGPITLGSTSNDFQSPVDLTGGSTVIVDSKALTLGALATGNLSATANGALNLGHGLVAGTLLAASGGNPISQGNAALVVTGDANFNAGAASIDLPQTGNDYGANVSLTGGTITLKASHTLTLAALNQIDNQPLTLQADSLQLPAGLNIDRGTANLSLSSLTSQWSTTGTLTGQDVSLQGGGGLGLDHAVTAHGQLTLASSTGAIKQNAALSVAGTTQVDAGTGNITLTASNDLAGAVSLAGGSTQITSAQALTLGKLATGNLVATANGPLNLGHGTVAGSLSANSNGNTITQATGGLDVSGTATLTAGPGDITLADAANDFAGTVNLSGAATSIADRNGLALGQLATGSLSASAAGPLDLGSGSVAGNLSASSQGGQLTQTGALNVAGSTTLTADRHALQATLDQAANHFGAGVQLAGSQGGAIAVALVQSADALSIGGAAGSLSVSSGGLLTLGAGQYTTLNATAVSGVTQSGALTVSGSATLGANGSPAMAVNLSHPGNDLNTVLLVAQSGGSLGSVRLVDGDGLRGDGLRVGGNAADLGIISAGALGFTGGSYGSLVADTSAQGANITQTGAITVAGGTSLNSGNGDISLALPGNDLNILAITAAHASVQDVNQLSMAASQVSQQLALGAPGNITMTAPLMGTGTLVMNGSGSLLIQGPQAYTGGTQVNAGTLVLDGTTAQAGNGGSVVLGANGRLDLRNNATLTNTLLSQGGTLANSAGTASLSGPMSLAADTTVDVAASAGGLTISGAIGDGGSHQGLALTGGGVLTLTGSNSYSGATLIQAGSLIAQGSNALPSTSAVTVDGGALLQLAQAQSIGSLSGSGQVDLQAFDLTTGYDNLSTSFSGNLTGTGGLAKQGNGSFTLAGSYTASGPVQVSQGTLVLAGGDALADTSAVTVAAGATLSLATSETLGTLAGAGTVDLQAQRLSVGGSNTSTEFAGALTGTGGLSKQGNGTLTLSGNNSYSGDTLVNAGTLQLAQPHALASTTAVSVAAGATLDLQSTVQIGSLAGAGQVALNANTLGTGGNNADSGFGGVITGSGGLAKTGSGNQTLAGSNSYTGPTTLAAGTLTLSGGTALADQNALTVASGAHLVVAGDETVGSLAGAGDVVLAGHTLSTGTDGTSTRFDGVISGDGGLAKLGTGSMTLGGANTYGGATTIQAGVLRVGDGTTHGSLGTGAVDNRSALVFDRSDAVVLDNAVAGSGSLTLQQGQLTLTSTANHYTGDTVVTAGTLATSGAERLPDGSTVRVGAAGQLQLAGNETVAAINADGAVVAAGNIATTGDQLYRGTLTLTNPLGTLLSGQQIDARQSGNHLGTGPVSITASVAQLTAAQDLVLGDVALSQGGQITADRLALNGALQLTGGALGLTATAAADAAKATVLGNAQVPVVGKSLAVAEATVLQGSAGVITVASGASLNVAATGGGSVTLAQDTNRFAGSLSVLSGAQFNTAWQPNVQAGLGVQSMVNVAGSQVAVGGAGIEADMVRIRADQLSTSGTAQLAARLPFDEVLLGTSLSAPSMTLELAPAAFQLGGAFGQSGGQEVHVAVGSRDIGGRSDGLNAGFLTIRPKKGAQGATAVFLVGPKVSTQVGGYRFFHDGASQLSEVPVFYNGVLPMAPQVSGALSSIDGDAEDARRAKFQETVRTENVTLRLRSGVIAEVGPGRPATQGSEGAKPPEACEPAAGQGLACQP